VADLNRTELRRLARLGAEARLAELRREEAAIRQAFPDLVRGRPARKPGRPAGGRRRRGMSSAQRKAVSERMKKYWADRRKGKSKKA
jgi:hypothetical protein